MSSAHWNPLGNFHKIAETRIWDFIVLGWAWVSEIQASRGQPGFRARGLSASSSRTSAEIEWTSAKLFYKLAVAHLCPLSPAMSCPL